MSARHVPTEGELLEQQHLMDASDEQFAHLAPGYPDTSSPVDFVASVTAGFVEPVDWDGPGRARRVADVETGGAL